jgi:hypothetical protein
VALDPKDVARQFAQLTGDHSRHKSVVADFIGGKTETVIWSVPGIRPAKRCRFNSLRGKG